MEARSQATREVVRDESLRRQQQPDLECLLSATAVGTAVVRVDPVTGKVRRIDDLPPGMWDSVVDVKVDGRGSRAIWGHLLDPSNPSMETKIFFAD